MSLAEEAIGEIIDYYCLKKIRSYNRKCTIRRPLSVAMGARRRAWIQVKNIYLRPSGKLSTACRTLVTLQRRFKHNVMC
jgi:hypothetical protein